MNKSSPYLLDTCAWIWLASGHPRIAKIADQLEQAASNDNLFTSAMSAWEIVVKANKGKISVSMDVGTWIKTSKEKLNLQSFPLDDVTLVYSTTLEMHHNDPADRIIVATAQLNSLTLVTGDEPMTKFCKKNGINFLKL